MVSRPLGTWCPPLALSIRPPSAIPVSGCVVLCKNNTPRLHTQLGITRLNVYAGLAGFFFIRNALDQPELPRIPFPPPGADPALTTSTQLRELPLAMQDR